MAIRVRHTPIRALVQAAAAGGRGLAEQREVARQDQLRMALLQQEAEQQRFDASLAAQERGQAAAQGRFDAGLAAQERSEAARLAAQREGQASAQAFAREQAETQTQDRMAELEARHQFGVQEFDHQFSVKQHAEINRINNAIAEVQANPNWTSDEKAFAIRQLEAQKLGIKPLPTPKEQQLSLAERFEQETLVLPNGVRYGIDKDGKYYSVGADEDNLRAVTVNERREIREIAQAMAGEDENGNPKPLTREHLSAAEAWMRGEPVEETPEPRGMTREELHNKVGILIPEGGAAPAQPTQQQRHAEVVQYLGIQLSPRESADLLGQDPAAKRRTFDKLATHAERTRDPALARRILQLRAQLNAQ